MLRRNKVQLNIISVLAALMLVFLAGCSFKPPVVTTIHIKGSETMLKLTELLAQNYMRLNPGISIYVEGGGTASGLRSLIRKEIDICTASRTIKSDEVKILADQFGSIGISYIIAKDALSIYLNEANPVDDLSIDDVKKLFTCKITNWKEIGGEDIPVIPVIRNPNSGTYLYFKEHILNEDNYCEGALTKASMDDLIDAVADNPGAVGYGGIGLGADLKHVKIDGVAPTEENVRNAKYPIVRYLHFYLLNNPEGEIKKFVDWVLSPEGQQIIRQAGYIPLFEIPF